METPPRFAHQERVLQETADTPAFAIFWEQGTGKTRLALETMSSLARQGSVDAALILAPNGVHQMWIQDEVPKWTDSARLFCCHYTSAKAGTKRHQTMMEQALVASFPVVAMSYDAFMTTRGIAWARKFLAKRRVFYVLDESTAIKTPGIQRTKSVVASGNYAQFKRIMTGTPINNCPFDVYMPVRFLMPDFWKQNGFQTYSEFKTFYGVWKIGSCWDPKKNCMREFQYVDSYRNLDHLNVLLAKISSRVLKSNVLDLPPKLYSKRYFELSAEQWRIYNEIKELGMALVRDELVTVPLVLTRLLRLHQVTSNYMPAEADEPTIQLGFPNPRLKCLEEAIEEVSGQAIIWARFNHDVDQIMELLGEDAVRCDGRDGATERQERIGRFNAGGVRFLVSKPQTKGVSRGQTMVSAHTVIYYNNTFSLEDRLQSEDRCHRSGQVNPVSYIDIVALGPNSVRIIDTHIVDALRNKMDIASQITGDQLQEWI